MVNRKLVIICFLLFGISTLFASPTGKLAGNITDAETGEPLIGANIIVIGKWLPNGKIENLEIPVGAASDIDGYYFILNLSPDRYVVEAKMMGYQTQRVVDLLIESGRTVKLDFVLTPTTVDMEEVVVTAEKEVVKLDVPSSETILNQEITKSLPVAGVEEIINLVPGVTVGQNYDISIRGGSSDEIMTYVDGFSMKNQIFNIPYLSFNRTSIKELVVKTGGFSAEYGDLRSGVIDLTTQAGGTKYSFALDARYEPADYRYYGPHQYTEDKMYLIYGSDWSMDFDILQEKFPHVEDYFMSWPTYSKQYLTDKEASNDMTPNQRREMWNWYHRGTEEGNIHDHVVDFTLSGPIPFTSNKLSFMFSYRDQQDAYAHPGIRDHFGVQNGQLKLSYMIIPSISVTFLGIHTKQSGMAQINTGSGIDAYIMTNGGGGEYVMNDPLGDLTMSNFGLSFKHVLSPSTFYEIKVNKMSTKYDFRPGPERDSTIIKTIPGEFYTVETGDTLNVHGYWDKATDTYIEKDTTFYSGDQMWCPAVELDETPDGYFPEGIGLSYPDQVGRVNLYETTNATEFSSGWTYNIQGDISHQLNKVHMFKAGFIYTESKIDRNWSKTTNYLNDEYYDVKYVEYPKYYAAYIQDNIDLKGFKANFGVRAELFDANTDILSPDDPFDSTFYLGSPDLPFRDRVDSLDKAPSEKYFYLSPRLGISHPITATSKIFFNYGHSYSTPRNSLRYGFRPKNYDWKRPQWIGNGNLKPYKTIQYEFGYEQVLLADYLIHGSIYYKDVTNQSGADDVIQYFRSSPADNSQAYYDSWSNKNYEDIIGIEMSFSKRVGKFIKGVLQVEFRGAKDGQIGFSILSPPGTEGTKYSQFAYPDDILWEWRPKFMLNLDLHTPMGWGPDILGTKFLGGWQLNTIINWEEGSKFTWSPDNDPSVYNNMQRVNWLMTDININKIIDLFGSQLVLYVNLHNLFNREVLNVGLLRGFDTDKHSEIYQYYNSLEDGDRVGDFKAGNIETGPERYGENFYDRLGGPVRVVFGIRYNIN